jgi:hypothetical protein
VVQLRPCVLKGNSPARAKWFSDGSGSSLLRLHVELRSGVNSIANEFLLSASMRSRVETVPHHPLSELRKPA